jgi:hypothetical protein
MAVQEGEDGLKLGEGVLVDIHEVRLVRLNHGQGA